MKPTQVARIASSLVQSHIPFMLRGPVGAGKSQVMGQVAESLKMELRDVRLAQMDPTDIKGFPSPDPVNNVMRWLPADFLPPMLINKKPNKTTGLLFLDELPSAPQAVQAAAYQLVLDRKVGNYTLPDGWAIAAAGNRDIDRSIVHRMPAALANRLVHLDFEVSIEDWSAHAMGQNISPELIAFLRFKTQLLHNFDASQNPVAFPTPRAWFTTDRIMKSPMADADKYETIKGTVGEGAATELRAFLSVIADLPSIEEIKLNPDSTEVPDSPSTLYALTTSLAMVTNKTGFARFMQYVERMPVEFQVVYVRDCVKRVNEIKLSKEFTAWGVKNENVLL